MIHSIALRAGIAALGLCAASGAPAQAIVPPPTPNADALAAQVRLLTANPRNVDALIAAGELSAKLADPDAAMAFFARAEAVDPRNPRIAAGKAGALVTMERPGEALRLYDQAERAGLSMTPYLAQRGLAYDLTGQPGHAQRDYRRALQAAPDDETVRRLALSLGMAGRREEAMTLLDPLLRRSDRAAWRSRAFILALSGDMAGADRIAATTLPGGAALGPFFRRLPALSPADRAFAVHFGEVNTNATRIADARLAPPVAVLPAEPVVVVQPVAVAAASPAPAPPAREPRRGRADATRREMQVASRVAPMSRSTPVTPTPTPTPAVVAPVRAAEPRAQAVTPAGAGWAVTADTPRPVASAPPSTPTPAPVADAVAAPAPVAQAAPSYIARPYVVIDAPRMGQVVRPVPAPRPTPTAAPAAPRRANETLLASIVAGIEIPASELDTRQPAVAPQRATVTAPRVAAIGPAPAKPVVREAAEAPALKPKTAQATVRPETRDRADAKSTRAKTADAVKKRPEPAKADTARWWVQVAGGARASDLDKDWKRLADKSSALKGKGAYVTPLRATNRLLTGPFGTEAEARAVVNALAKEGKSAFTFQSAAGQKVDRLGGK